MTSLSAFVLRFRLLVLGVAAAVLAVGAAQLRSAPVDLLPEFTPPYAEIQTEALGLSAEEVEQLITVPLEADLLNGVEGVEVIRSESVPGLSSIVLVFAGGTDVYRARQLVEERLTQAHALPNVSRPPTLLPPLSSSSRVLMIGLSSQELTPIEQSVVARWTVRPRLMGVPGVANVAVWGMRDQQLQVQVDPARLRDRKVTLSQVVATAGNAQVVSPLSFLEASTPGTGGFVETPQQRLQVRHLLERIADPAELGKVPVEDTEGALRLSDVADLVVDHQPLIGDAVVGGGPGLLLVVEKFPGTDVLAVTEGVEDALERLRPGLTGMTVDTSVFRPAGYLEDALESLGTALLIGAGLLVLGLLALRAPWRAVLVAVVTVPLSLVAAALVLRLLGQGFNALVLAGLAAAVTVVVDEAVAPGVAVARRLREAGEGTAVPETVRDASAQERLPLVYATLVLLAVVVPAAVVGGRPGAFFAPVLLAYVVAVGVAVLVAVTVAPALTTLLAGRYRPRPARQRSRWSARGAGAHAAALRRLSHRPSGAGLAAGALALVGLAVLPFLETSLLPPFAEREVLVRLQGEPGASNPRMTAATTGLSRELSSLPGVAGVAAHIGRAVTGDRVTGVSSSDVWVRLDPDADSDRRCARSARPPTGVEGVRATTTTYAATALQHVGVLRSGRDPVPGDGLSSLTGVTDPVAVRVYGQDPAVLRREADRVRELMAQVEGVVDPRVEQSDLQPTVEIEVDLQKAQAFGLTPGDVRRAEATLLQGIQVGSVFEQQKVFDVVVQGAPGTRRSVEDVRGLLIDRPTGGHVTLGEVADVRTTDTPAVIRRDAVSRRLDVTAGLDGRSADDVAADLRTRLAAVDLPLEYHAEVVSGSTAEEVGSGRVLGTALAAAVAVLLLLQAAFRSWRLALLVLASLPLALVGGLLAVLLRGGDLTLGGLLGLLAVLALAARTGTTLVGDLRQRDRDRPAEDAGELVVAGAADRLAPVLTSTVGVALLVLPFALAGSRPGFEVLHELAVVLLCGLVTSTVVTLLLLPALYLHVRPRGRQEAPGDDELPRQRESAGRAARPAGRDVGALPVHRTATS